MVAQQDPVAHALMKLQKDGSNIADAVDAWLVLLEEFPSNGPIALVKERATYTLECPFMLAAYCLDPRHCGKKLKPKQLAAARNFVAQISGEHSKQFTVFLAQSSPFDQELFSVPGDPLDWWSVGARSGFLRNCVTWPADFCLVKQLPPPLNGFLVPSV